MKLLTPESLLAAARFVRNHKTELALVAWVTGNRLDDWAVRILTRVAENEDSVEAVVAWLKWFGVCGASNLQTAPVLPATFADLERDLVRLQTHLLEVEIGS